MKIIKNFFTKVNQQFCNHNSFYTEMSYWANEYHWRKIRKCNDCGFGKEKFAEAQKFCLERDGLNKV